MNENKKTKVRQVKEIVDNLTKAHALVIIEYTTLGVKDLQAIRRDLKKSQITLKVYKNRLFKLAAKELGFSALDAALTGQNAFAFGFDDDIAPAKMLAEFAKKYKSLRFRGGVFEGKAVDANEIVNISKYFSYEEGLGVLANQMISPLKFIAKGLHDLTNSDKLAKGE